MSSGSESDSDPRFDFGLTSTTFRIPVDDTRRGQGAAHGIAIGRVYMVDRRRLKVPKRRLDGDDEIDEEIERFQRAIATSDRQLERIKNKIAQREADHHNIITAHQLILHDENLVDRTIAHIQRKKINAEWALRKTVEHIKGIFDAVEDDYFRERRSDVEFVGDRVLRNLLGREQTVKPPPDAVVVAHDLSPADTAQLHKARVAGLCTDAGGKTSHTAIMARAHEIPAVVGLEDITELVSNGDLLIVDGTEGVVIINPSPECVSDYRERARREAAADAALLSNRDLPAVTTDGVTVTLRANVDHLDELASAVGHGAEGIGLFRTEFLYMGRDALPTEEEHYQHACSLIQAMPGQPVTIRTIDFGADKVAQFLSEVHTDRNPALGMRSLRLCMTPSVRPLAVAQIRGILRASAHGNVRILFPMVSGVGELVGARELLNEAMNGLKAGGFAFNENIPVGIMVELPSAAIVADHLATRVDFFSLGTNDLIQYTLAVDRVNEHVAYLYEPMHPALLRLVDMTIRAARGAGISVSLCGEMAADPEVALLLVGMGLTELSMNSVAIPEVKRVVRAATAEGLQELAARALALPTASDVRDAVRASIGHLLPSLDAPAGDAAE